MNLPPAFADLDPSEIVLLGLFGQLGHLQADVNLHRVLLEKILSSELHGQPLEQVYSAQHDDFLRRAFAAIADHDAAFASRLAELSALLRANKKSE